MTNVKIYDLNDYETSIKNGLYGGAAGSKDGILIDNENWMIKYPKTTRSMKDVDISYTTSPICEYLGSHVFQILGYDTHETILGIRHGKLVVACKDFTDENTTLAEIRTIRNHANEVLSEELGIDMESTGDAHRVNLENLLLHIRNNPILKVIPGVEERFFEQSVVDIYINNNDRNNGNWGVLRHTDGELDTLAPIYDNGGSFQDKLSNDKAARVLENVTLAREYAYGTQTAYADNNGRIISAYRFLSLCDKYPKLNEAIIKVVPMIQNHQQEIIDLIDSLPERYKDKQGKEYEVCGEYIKELFKVQLSARTELLLEPALQRSLIERNRIMTISRSDVSIDEELER